MESEQEINHKRTPNMGFLGTATIGVHAAGFGIEHSAGVV